MRFVRPLLALLLFTLTASGESEVGSPAAPERPRSRAERARPTWDQGPLGAQSAQLERLYREHGRVQRLRPRFLDESEPLPFVLDSRILNPATESCVTVVALGSPNLAFLLLFDDENADPARRAWPVPSAAGVAEVTRCGARKMLLEGLSIKLRSRRGIVEFLVVESEHPPPPVSELLPGRNPGLSHPSPQVGRRPWLAPLRERVDDLVKQAEAQGATLAPPSGIVADESGRGTSAINLDPGCHRLMLLAEPDKEAPPDLDARLSTLTRGEELAVDEEHSGQVRLEHCVGRASRVHLDFSGARALGEVTLLQASWGLPEGVPVSWGPFSRSRLAEAMFDGGLPELPDPPIFSSLGVRGMTNTHVEIDPEGCYLASVATIRGEAQGVAMGVEVDGRAHTARANLTDTGASISFCASGAESATLQVQVGGAGVAWILGVWTREGAPSP